MKDFKLPKVKNILKAPKMLPPKIKWEREFEDEIYFIGKVETSQEDIDSLELNRHDFSDFIMKYIGFEKTKIKIKVRKGAILIEKIR